MTVSLLHRHMPGRTMASTFSCGHRSMLAQAASQFLQNQHRTNRSQLLTLLIQHRRRLLTTFLQIAAEVVTMDTAAETEAKTMTLCFPTTAGCRTANGGESGSLV